MMHLCIYFVMSVFLRIVYDVYAKYVQYTYDIKYVSFLGGVNDAKNVHSRSTQA